MAQWRLGFRETGSSFRCAMLLPFL